MGEMSLGGWNFINNSPNLYYGEARSRDDYRENVASWKIESGSTLEAIPDKYPLNVTEGSAISSFFGKEMHDRVLRHYWRIKNAGGILPVNPCLSIQDEWDASPINFNYTRSKNGWLYIHRGNFYPFTTLDLLQPSPVAQSDIDNLVDRVVMKAKARVTSAGMMSLVTLAELRKTVDMLKTGLATIMVMSTDIARILSHLLDPETGILRDPAKAYLAFENAWMQIRLGWRPFRKECQDVHNIISDVKEHVERQTFRASDSIVTTDTYETFYESAIDFNVRKLVTQTVRASAGYLCTQKYGGLPDTWGLMTIPETLWELTPLSWAVDYFIDVGDFLAANTPDTFWDPKQSWVTIRKVTQHTNLCYNYRTPLYYKGSASGGQCTLITREMERIPSPEQPDSPLLCADLSLAQWTDVSAVARQMAKKAFTKLQIIGSLLGLKGPKRRR